MSFYTEACHLYTHMFINIHIHVYAFEYDKTDV